MSEKIYDTPDLMGKRITGIGHKPWRDWSEAEPVLIADGEQVRVTRDAYLAINFRQFNNELWPRRWESGHCIWMLESRLFDIFEYDSRFIPDRAHAGLPYSSYTVYIATEHGSFSLDDVKARTQMEAELVASELVEYYIKHEASFACIKFPLMKEGTELANVKRNPPSAKKAGPPPAPQPSGNDDLIDIEKDNE